MVNYRGSAQTRIEIGPVSSSIPIGAKVVLLIDGVAGSNAADGMIDVADNLIYSVPTGKTFYALGIQLTSVTAVAETIVLSTGDTENAETGTVQSMQIPYLQLEPVWFHVAFTLQAGKFLTYNPSGTGVQFIQVIGYEF